MYNIVIRQIYITYEVNTLVSLVYIIFYLKLSGNLLPVDSEQLQEKMEYLQGTYGKMLKVSHAWLLQYDFKRWSFRQWCMISKEKRKVKLKSR